MCWASQSPQDPAQALIPGTLKTAECGPCLRMPSPPPPRLPASGQLQAHMCTSISGPSVLVSSGADIPYDQGRNS